MTNRDFMAGLLKDRASVDDGGAAYEVMVHYNIACPYHVGDERAHCYSDDTDTEPDRKVCVACKDEWLDMEVDQ